MTISQQLTDLIQASDNLSQSITTQLQNVNQKADSKETPEGAQEKVDTHASAEGAHTASQITDQERAQNCQQSLNTLHGRTSDGTYQIKVVHGMIALEEII